MIRLEHIKYEVQEEHVGKEIIRDVSLTLPDNTFIVLTGPNGGGKSTLAKLIAGIETPTEGHIFLDDREITGLDVTERAKAGISFAFQQPVRFKGLQVYDLLKIASGKELSITDACQYLSEVGLCARDYIRREVNASLSGGDLKRIEIATVLARHTPVTIFDEPEAGIDLWSFQSLIQVFRRMREQMHGTIMIISHQERILEIADEIVVIGNGRITEQGPREEILPRLAASGAAARDYEGGSDGQY